MPLDEKLEDICSARRKCDSYPFEVIFTIEAQNNVFLEVMTEHSRLSNEQVFGEIWQLARDLRQGLASKGIEYGELRNALVPQTGVMVN